MCVRCECWQETEEYVDRGFFSCVHDFVVTDKAIALYSSGVVALVVVARTER